MKLLKDKIDKEEAFDKYLPRVTFKTPFVDFIDYLVPGFSPIAWIVPRYSIEKVGDEEFEKHPTGRGPYKSVEHKPGSGLQGSPEAGKARSERFYCYWKNPPKARFTSGGKDSTRFYPGELRSYRRKVQAVFQGPFSSLSPRLKVRKIITEPLEATAQIRKSE